MSVKAMGMVWDLDCPKTYNGIEFRPSHKFTLLAYADHADHYGKNIFPAVSTISKKTGLDERTTQRLTRDLTTMGLMVLDGQGPRGTNRFSLAYDERGWHPVTLSTCQGDINNNSSGDIPSGDIPSGDNVPPEFKEPEPPIDSLTGKVWTDLLTILESSIPRRDWRGVSERLLRTYPVYIADDVLTLNVQDRETLEWLDSRMKAYMNRALPAITKSETTVRFMLAQ